MNDNAEVTDDAEVLYVVRCSEAAETLTTRDLTLINAEGLAEYFNNSHREGHCIGPQP